MRLLRLTEAALVNANDSKGFVTQKSCYLVEAS